MPLCVKAGTAVILPYDLHHAAFPHGGDNVQARWMFKFQFTRTRPGGPFPKCARPPEVPVADYVCPGKEVFPPLPNVPWLARQAVPPAWPQCEGGEPERDGMPREGSHFGLRFEEIELGEKVLNSSEVTRRISIFAATGENTAERYFAGQRLPVATLLTILLHGGVHSDRMVALRYL